MRVAVAGSSSVLGLPVVAALVERGHDVVGFTRRERAAAALRGVGARTRPLDVFDAAAVDAVLLEERPDAIVSLLMELPRFGAKRLRDFEPTRRLWTVGVPNLISAAARAGSTAFVGESMVFAYGYDRFTAELTEQNPCPGPPPLGEAGRPMLDALRGMEAQVLDGSSPDMRRTVLRFGIFHGPGVPHTRYLTSLVKAWAMPAPTGGAVVPWVELSDAAAATVAAVERPTAQGILNVVDDEQIAFRDYLNAFAEALHRPRPWPMPRSLLRVVAPYAALAFGGVELRVSNAAAKRALDWTPRNPTCRDVFALP